MTETAEKKPREGRAEVYLRPASVTSSFRDNLFDACQREGLTPNEYVLQAAAEKLKAKGRKFSGIFRANDLDTMNGGMGLHWPA